MGWFFLGDRSNSPRNPGPLVKRLKLRLQLEHLEERMVLDNRFQVPAGPLIDIQLNGTSASVDTASPAVHADLSGTITTMANNKINLTVSSVVDDEVVISANAAGTPIGAVIGVNPINTNGLGTGSAAEQVSDQTSGFRLQAQGIEFHSSSIGIFVPPLSDASNLSVAGFDLSGSNESGLAGSDFRSVISPSLATFSAFVGDVMATGRSNISAQPSHFANSINFRIVGFERNTSRDMMNSLASSAALVDSIYEDLFRRVHNNTNPTHADSWVNTLSIAQMTPTSAAKDLLHSGEGIGGLIAQVNQGQNETFRMIKEKRRLRQLPGFKSIPNEEGT